MVIFASNVRVKWIPNVPTGKMPPPSQLNNANPSFHNAYSTRDSSSQLLFVFYWQLAPSATLLCEQWTLFLRVVLHLPFMISNRRLLNSTLHPSRSTLYHFYTCNVCDPVIAMISTVSCFHRSFECHIHAYTNVSSRLNLVRQKMRFNHLTSCISINRPSPPCICLVSTFADHSYHLS